MAFCALTMAYGDISIILIAVIIALSGVVINLVKKGGRTQVVYEQDGGTLLAFRLVVPVALVASVAVYFLKVGHIAAFPAGLLYAGYLLVAAGLLIRWVAVLSLGDAFTVKVTILKNHGLNTGGIYKNIRHPSYTGLLMYYLGLGLVMQNWVCLAVLAAAPLWVTLNRIKLEERVLNSHFGDEYKAYSLRAWKLLPYIF